jgi:hypothetical protein
MDATITYDEVAALVGVNILTLEPRPNFERIRALRRHLERCLQRLPCPQSIQHGWKGMVIAHELYSLLTSIPFCLPTNLVAAAIYVRAVTTGQLVNNAPLSRTEQGRNTFGTCFGETGLKIRPDVFCHNNGEQKKHVLLCKMSPASHFFLFEKGEKNNK